MADKDRAKLAADGFAWFGNVSTSVCIIFVNKVLMSSTGYGFRYATTLCAAHYLACSASIYATQTMGYVKKVSLPAADLALFTATANTSIVTLNLSLLLNKVGFYQIAKLLIIPFVCLVERFWLGKQFSARVIMSVVTVVCGVGIVTVSDFAMGDNMLGLIVAALSVVSSGMQQIFCRSMQQKHKLSSHELLSNTAPAQGWSLLLIGPFLDYYVVDAWVLDYTWSTAAAVALATSCALAVLVNLSQFACLGRFTAVSYQVLGHSKTILVLLGGWLFLGDVITVKQAGGMVLAVAGMVGYGIASSHETAAAAAAALTKAPNGASYSVGRGASADEEAALLAKEPGAAKALAESAPAKGDKKDGVLDVETPLLKEDLASAVSGHNGHIRSNSASDLKAALNFKRESV